MRAQSDSFAGCGPLRELSEFPRMLVDPNSSWCLIVGLFSSYTCQLHKLPEWTLKPSIRSSNQPVTGHTPVTTTTTQSRLSLGGNWCIWREAKQAGEKMKPLTGRFEPELPVRRQHRRLRRWSCRKHHCLMVLPFCFPSAPCVDVGMLEKIISFLTQYVWDEKKKKSLV